MYRHRPDKDSDAQSIWSRQTPTLLSAEAEQSLILLAQQGDQEAKQKLIDCNIRLVVNIAKTYRTRSIPLDDLIQEGIIGLMTAIERFDLTRGFRFSTYATHWIRQGICGALDSKAKTIRLPAYICQALRRIEKAKVEIYEETGSEPTPEQISERVGIPLHRLNAILQCSYDLLSLDVSIGQYDQETFGSFIHDERAGNPEAIVLNSEIVEELHELIKFLSESERRVIYGTFRDGKEDNYSDVADELQITKERARQIELRAIRKLRVLARRQSKGLI